MKVMRKIIEIDEEKCDGCGMCVPSCAEGALQIIDGKAKLVSDVYCDGLGACLGECPQGALNVVEREAEEFDGVAVEKYLSENEPKPQQPHACPSAGIQMFVPKQEGLSPLTHWPIKLRLVPPHAPFLKNAELVIVADCVPATFSTFHQDFLKGKVLLLGCPKFDPVDEYIQKLTQIFKTSSIRNIMNIVMEVPCCSALPVIVRKAMEAAGVDIPTKKVVISTRGEIMGK